MMKPLKMEETTVDNNILEKLANLEHEQWAHWEEYRAAREVTLSKSKFKAQEADWFRLRCLSYTDLTEKEKESDREWARKVLALIIKEATEFEKSLIEHPLLDQETKKKGSATIHDFIMHLNFQQGMLLGKD